MVVCPRHDYASEDAAPPNVVLTHGSLHSVTVAALAAARSQWEDTMCSMPSPRLALLLGGKLSRRWWQQPLAPELTASSASSLVRSAVASVVTQGGSLLVTTSRRTPPDAGDAVASELAAAAAAGVACRLWDADAQPNPYLGLLAWADYLVVTADSINMVTEACATTRPVYVVAPSDCRRRFATFHSRLLQQGRVRAWPEGRGSVTFHIIYGDLSYHIHIHRIQPCI